MLDGARAWHRAGCSVLPIALDGTKRPVGQWRDRQTTRPTDDQVEREFAGPVGVAVATGSASGNLEMFEIEGPRTEAAELVRQLAEACEAAGIGGVWQKIAAGYVEQSPKGGVHLFYRVAGRDVPGNTKLARRYKTDDELNDDERARRRDRPEQQFIHTMIETRGQGGYVIVAPTPAAASDPTGPYGQKPWVAFPGKTPDMIPTISAELRDELHRVAATFDRTSRAATALTAPQTALVGPAADSDRPGDVFARTTDWQAILGPHGWKKAFGPDGQGKTYWTRPGKRYGISATTTDDGPGGLWVFSTSTTFEAETLYTKFGAYAHLEHGDDLSAAASALAGPSLSSAPLTPLAPAAAFPTATGAGNSPGAPPADGPAANPVSGGPGEHADAIGGSSQAPAPASVPPAAGIGGASWQPVDLGAFLAGDYTPPAAAYMPRTDGVSLFYAGKTHSVFGESESGKSMVVQAEIARLLAQPDGGRCAYIDYEDEPAGVVGRLLALGAPREAIATRFDYIKPTASPYAAVEVDEFRTLLGRQYAIIALDGVTTALGHMGDPKGDPNAHVTSWARRVLDPLAYWTGAAVILIDHQGKNADARGRFQRGASAKMDVLTGAAYIVEPSGRMPIGRGLCGELEMRIAKDRPGGVRPHCGPRRTEDRTQAAARIVVDSRDGGDKIIVTVNRQLDGDVERGSDHDERAGRLDEVKENITRYVAMVGAASGRQIRKEVRGRTTDVVDAIRSLVAGGYLLQTETSSRGGAGFRYTLLAPYVANNPVPGSQVVPGGSMEPGRPGSPTRFPDPVPPLPLGEGDRVPGGTVDEKDQEQGEAIEPTLDPPTAGAPPVAFLAPTAPALASLVAPVVEPEQRLTRNGTGKVMCERIGCGEYVDPQLVEQGMTRHFGCEEG